MKCLFPIVVLLACGGAACDVKVGENGGISLDIARGKATDQWTRTYTVSPGGRVEIVNENGAIAADAADGPQLEVRADRQTRADSDDAARALLRDLQMIEQAGADHVHVETGHMGPGAPPARRSAVSVEYHLRIPRGLVVTLHTQNGGVSMTNLDGRITASTTNGAIAAQHLAGSLEAATINGGMQIDLASITGDVTLTSVNGGIRVSLPPMIHAAIDASAVNGGVTIDDALSLRGGEASPLHASGVLNGGGPKVSVHTTNGGVRVTAGPLLRRVAPRP